MEDLRTHAQLVAFDGVGAPAGAIGTVVSRAEIEDAAAQSDFPATLILDLDRVETADDNAFTAHATVAVDWDEQTLEQLLASTEDTEIALWFDERELTRVFEERDVEGHSLRQKAAVLAVAVTAVGAGAGPSLAAFPADTGGGGGAAQTTFNANPHATVQGPAVQSAGAERALQQDENLAVQQTSVAGSPAATSSGGGMSSGELAAIVGAGAVLISAAGFGATRKRMPPAQPA